MQRKDLVEAIAKKTGLTQKDTAAVIDAFGETLESAAKSGEKVQIPGLLTMEVVDRAARKGRNPQTGEEMEIPAGKSVKISAGTTLKRAVKG
ncbi:MAG: integration host factor [Propionibacterium sp.]|nr:integration host factor [Propionibacterium sp.]